MAYSGEGGLQCSDSSPTTGTFEGLSDALTIWVNKPHVVNRRLCGSRIRVQKVFKKGMMYENELENILKRLGYHINEFHESVRGINKCSNYDSAIRAESCDNPERKDPEIVPEPSNTNNISTDDATNTVKTPYAIPLEGPCINTSSGNGEKSMLIGQVGVDSPDISKRKTDFSQESLHHDSESRNGDNVLVQEIDSSLWTTDENHVMLIVRELLPKQPERHRNMPELIIYDKDVRCCTFFPLLPIGSTNTGTTEVVYRFSLIGSENQNSIELCVSEVDQTRDSERKLSLTWLKDVLLKKLARWSETPNLKTSITSLVLVAVDEYSRLYSELKNKYGLHFAKIWPENTDPQKFVFEDVSIATYLLLLWQQDREKKGLKQKQSFVDLGCGNGLLVHILASEGHPGYGVDIRKRKIWDLYGPETVLKEYTVTPSSDCLFPESDWLIGNHSDELTPWIPVMASRSSYTCSYFVLPCCHYDFHAKFSYDPEFGRVADGQYQCYLNYVRRVGEECAFHVEEDILRIPSTKRVCFIGRSRSYDQSQEEEMDQSRQAFIDWRCGQMMSCDNTDNPNSPEKWTQHFTPREKVESIRNCVTVSQLVKNKVIDKVFNTLLESGTSEVKMGHDGRGWRKGGHIAMDQVSELFDKMTLAELKSECGGLQTLLRNCNQVFQVSGGQVQLRDFTQEDPFEGKKKKKGRPTNKADFHKTSLCWFYVHHPDGCPRLSDSCMYAHGETELRDKPTKNKT